NGQEVGAGRIHAFWRTGLPLIADRDSGTCRLRREGDHKVISVFHLSSNSRLNTGLSIQSPAVKLIPVIEGRSPNDVISSEIVDTILICFYDHRVIGADISKRSVDCR